ncbi:MAG: hypothetical protein ACYTGL_17810 [Planctomycetota bacterium]|jgi:hypothetical protein
MRLRLFKRMAPNTADQTLRAIVAHPGIGPGSRILLNGSCDDGIIRGLLSLGCLVTLGTDCETEAEQLEARFPQADCNVAAVVRHQFDRQAIDFDLIATFPGSEPFASNLLTLPAMTATAGLIGCLRPSGVYLMLPLDDSQDSPRHSTRCCVRHLSTFVAAAQQTGTVLRCSASRAPLFEMASVTAPEEPHSFDAWHKVAQLAVDARATDSCCEIPDQKRQKRPAA